VSSFLQFIGILLVIVHSKGKYVSSMTKLAHVTKDIFDMGIMNFFVFSNFIGNKLTNMSEILFSSVNGYSCIFKNSNCT
jgi:hypothetical protein